MQSVNLSLLSVMLFLYYVEDCVSLLCNYCYQADLKADCHLNALHCEPDHVCSVESSLVTYRLAKGVYKKMNMYRMGCEHYSMCRDKTVSGPGPYGYAVTTRICCCSDLCEDPDGAGQGQTETYPSLWNNYTMMYSSSSSSAGEGSLWRKGGEGVVGRGYLGLFLVIIMGVLTISC